MISFEDFRKNVASIRRRVEIACEASGRTVDSVSLLPVTKTHSADAVNYAAELGFSSVGENRVQEVQEKIETGRAASIAFELIGHLQSNKAKQAVELCDRIQSLDSEKLMRRIDRIAGEIGKTQRVLVQVNAGDDPAKFGIHRDALEPFLESASGLKNLKIEGLMTIAPLDEDIEIARKTFERLRIARDAASGKLGIKLPELSMGMTGDLEVAIQEGSTQIRVGSALYGARSYPT